MLPEARLEELLEQALTQQLSSTDFQDPAQLPVSLFTDLSQNKVHVPNRTVQVSLTARGGRQSVSWPFACMSFEGNKVYKSLVGCLSAFAHLSRDCRRRTLYLQ